MVFEPQNAARLQGLKEGPEGRIRGAVPHPIMDIAKGQNEIGAARRRDVLITASEFGHGGLAIEFRACGDFHFERGDVPRRVAGRRIAAAILKVGRQNFGPKPAFPGTISTTFESAFTPKKVRTSKGCR